MADTPSSDSLGQERYQQSKAAYERATTLLPNDADWHYGFAELLCWNAGWNNFDVNSNEAAWEECVTQIKYTLDINPSHEKTKELIDYFEFSGMIDFSGQQPDYLILTHQATVTQVFETVVTLTSATNTPQVRLRNQLKL